VPAGSVTERSAQPVKGKRYSPKKKLRGRVALGGAMLRLSDGIDGAAAVVALVGYESSFGANCKPRHDPHYHDLAAKSINARLTALTARRAAMRIARLDRGRSCW